MAGILKPFFFTVMCVMVYPSLAWHESDSLRNKNGNVLSFEAAGTGLIYSVTYERVFGYDKPRSKFLKIGTGVANWASLTTEYGALYKFRDRPSGLEWALALTAWVNLGYNGEFARASAADGNLIYTFRVGYRYRKPDKLEVKTFIMMNYSVFGAYAFPWGGASIGIPF